MAAGPGKKEEAQEVDGLAKNWPEKRKMGRPKRKGRKRKEKEVLGWVKGILVQTENKVLLFSKLVFETKF